MLAQIVTERLALPPSPATVVLLFFSYSFLGYILECIVLTREQKQLVINRGFVKHLPFCIIYGFGAMIGFALLGPLRHTWVPLFLVGAVAATCFEYLVAQMQIRIFGELWWDYSEKPFNFKGILCLESTIGWGVAALLIIKLLHVNLAGLVSRVPSRIAIPVAIALLAAYVLDFTYSARVAQIKKRTNMELEAGEQESTP